jgi:diguanylate cyclase (GGDEF)-like protein
MLKIIDNNLSALTTPTNLALAISLVILIGGLDTITGNEMAFTIFYVLPIALATWYCGRKHGVFIALFSAILWLIADLSGIKTYSSEWIPYWNASVRFSMFLLISILVSIVKRQLLNEEKLADVDSLTGISNRHAFIETLDMEIERYNRYKDPFTIAFIDLDSFKLVNDTMGHHIGDKVLITVSETLARDIRHSDMCARIGGDEFTILLLKSGFDESAMILSKLHMALNSAMKQQLWPITFSIGAITVDMPCNSSAKLLKVSDALMYKVKLSTKNNLLHKLWSEVN